MNQFYVIIALVAAFAHGEEEPFSIGLGVLSPSYSQTVGKENVKVNFEQKDNGFSYSVGDPSSGTNTFLNFGPAAAGASINPSGFADINPSGYAGPSPLEYTGPSQSEYNGPSQSAYNGPSQSAYNGPSQSEYSGLGSTGYSAPQSNPGYTGYAGYQPQSLGGNSGFGASSYGSGNAFGGSSGISSLYNDQASAPVAPSGYFGESARKPEEPAQQFLPAGFSYHGTEGQSFLRQGDGSPNFLVSDEKKETARGQAEQSFYNSFRGSVPEGSGSKVLVNGLVGYGPGGQRGSLPVGGYAGPQSAGVFKEHGGHE